jgi:hypothetical protein
MLKHSMTGIFEDMLTEIQDKCWLRDSSTTISKDSPENAHRFDKPSVFFAWQHDIWIVILMNTRQSKL